MPPHSLTRPRLNPLTFAPHLPTPPTPCTHNRTPSRAAEYPPGDAAADQALAATVPAGGGYEQREALCAAVRVRERAVLARTEFVAGQRAKALRKVRR